MECLREEARLLSSINHPNIVKVYEFVETNTFIYLRMEIIRNGTLGIRFIIVREAHQRQVERGHQVHRPGNGGYHGLHFP